MNALALARRPSGGSLLARAACVLSCGILAASAATTTPGTPAASTSAPPSLDPAAELRRKKSHWAFQAPVRPALPPVRNRRWVRNPIDQFVLARLEKEGLAPAPEADRTTLIRRL